MVRLISLRESIRSFYRRYGVTLRPVLKALLTFFVLFFLSKIFAYQSVANHIYVFVVAAAMQAFLPLSFLYIAGSILIAANLFTVSPEIMLVFLAVALICRLIVVYDEPSYCILVMLIPVLFYLKLEFFVPVLVGMICGIGGIVPVTGGILVYYIGVCTRDVSALLDSAADGAAGAGLQRMIQLFSEDRQLFTMLVVFNLVVFLSAVLYRIFHERAWQFAAVIGNVVLAFLLLSARLLFELDYSIYRVFLECILAFFLAAGYQLFKGIGDLGRIEKVTFEDDEYIYYVKAVPKIQLSLTERSVTRIQPEDTPDSAEEREQGNREALEEADSDIIETEPVTEGSESVSEGTE